MIILVTILIILSATILPYLVGKRIYKNFDIIMAWTAGMVCILGTFSIVALVCMIYCLAETIVLIHSS